MDSKLVRTPVKLPPANKPCLILYYDTLWGSPPTSDVRLPQGFEITTDRARYREADAVVFHIPAWKWKPRVLFPKKLPGQLWVAWSMECEENYPRLQDPNFMQAFDLTMTYRLDSDVPVPYFPFFSSARNLARAMREPAPPKTTDAPMVMLISSRIDRSGRRAYARELMRYLPVDSYGKFLRNKKIEQDRGRPSKNKIIARYKFTLAFENAIAHDYVTEKFFDPLAFGSVPIYLGAPNVENFAPGDHCYINVRDYENPRVLADYVLALTHDETAYNRYLEWRQKPLRPAFMDLVARFTPHYQVVLCQTVARRLASPDKSI